MSYKKNSSKNSGKQVQYPKPKKGGFLKPSVKKPAPYKYKDI